MPKLIYEVTNFQPKALEVIAQANAIIEEYAKSGYDLTLRQLYYQFVSKNLIPNRDNEYKKLGETISKARRAGLVDWNAIVDRTRSLRDLPHWNRPSDIISASASQFRRDIWEAQPRHVEVWFEKDAMLGVLGRASNQRRVPYFSCRGYTSDSEVWAAAQRIIATGKPTLVLHFGDHDPSGLDMTRDIMDRLEMFGASKVEVERIALNMDQVTEYNPPPNPAKITDSRFAAYQSEYGNESWELDALSPQVLAELVSSKVGKVVDVEAWEAVEAQEAKDRSNLRFLSDHYEQILEDR